jgi:cephalosporin hydroxylase
MTLTPAAAVRALRRVALRRKIGSAKIRNRTSRDFHRLYFHSKERTWKNNTFWLNTPVAKCPLDLWIYQEIINETLPTIIVETGTAHGGSALFLASMCDLLGSGRIVTVDVSEQPQKPQHDRISYISNSSTSEETISQLKSLIKTDDKVMVILDSDHRATHVSRELELYSPLVSVGCYLIVEDTNINGHPVFPEFGPGPMEAVERFLESNRSFAPDETREKFFLTFNPRGYLKRVR